MRIMVGFVVVVFTCAATLLGWDPTPEQQAALNRISAQSMRGHLSFLASDALEGRGTPSRGLDIAAEYIAAQFRRAGLEPAGQNGSYFQVADFSEIRQKAEDLQITIKAGGKSSTFSKADAWLRISASLDMNDAPLVHLPAENINGKVVVGDSLMFGRLPELVKLREQKPALIILVSRRSRPNLPETQLQPVDVPDATGTVTLFGSKAVAVLDSKDAETVSFHISAPDRKRVSVRNVAGIFRGSDPLFKDSFVILSAHYDHLGLRAEGSGDRVFNGANDNGSGTVCVIETASALASIAAHPKRSILFITFFGEEEGLLGAYYYTKHPLVPLAKTIVNINLEQMGRTDEQDGKQVASFAFTGPSYSTVPKLMEEAAKPEGVHVYSKNHADAFFGRSDNYAFAQAGIVDHTVVVAFEFPDYHAVGDEWEKIDYANMEKVDRGVAAGLLRMADDPVAPKWSNIPAVEQFRREASK